MWLGSCVHAASLCEFTGVSVLSTHSFTFLWTVMSICECITHIAETNLILQLINTLILIFCLLLLPYKIQYLLRTLASCFPIFSPNPSWQVIKSWLYFLNTDLLSFTISIVIMKVCCYHSQLNSYRNPLSGLHFLNFCTVQCL